jgi:hypothetical protein
MKELGKLAIESIKDCWYKRDMDWAWIAVMTLRLTRANIIRIKEAFLEFVTANPELSAVGFFIVILAAVILILKYARSG